MSEINLNDQVEEVVEDAEVITVPIDATLTHSGEAADAKAVGDALAQKADKSEVQSNITVNGKSKDAHGNIAVNAEDIPYATGTSVKAKIDAMTAETLKMSNAEGAQSIADAIDNMATRTADQIPMEQGSIETVADKLEEIETNVTGVAQSVTALDNKTENAINNAVDTLEDSIDSAVETLQGNIDTLDDSAVKSVNEIMPDANGNVNLRVVPYADNLHTDDAQQTEGEFIIRPTSGYGSVSDGNAWLVRLLGNITHDGFVPESIGMSVIPMPRPVPVAITAVLDSAVYIAEVGTAGTTNFAYTNAWDNDPATYGITVTGTPVDGDAMSVTWDGENDPVLSVSPASREAPEPITATIDRDTFVNFVSESGTINLYFTTEWSADPVDYGISVVGEPVSGDQIRVVYVKEERGTIRTAQFTKLVGTGWNLYDHVNGYARVCRYSETYGYKIGGTYTSIKFVKAIGGTETTITPDSDGLFMVPEDGYIIVEGGNGTDTYIYTTWSDWEDYTPPFEVYNEYPVNLATVMANSFPYGLLKVGDVADEIDVNNAVAIRRILRLEYNAENLEMVKNSGRAYVYDTNYIYTVRATPVTDTITINEEFTVSEHGLEWFDGTSVPVYAEVLYGQNLKDKLRRDVLTISPQALSATEKAQVQQNLNVPDASSVNENIAKLREGIAIIVDGDTASVAVPVGGYAYIKNNTHGLAEGMYKNTSSFAFPASGGTANSTVFTTVPTGAVNDAVTSLNSNSKFYPTLNNATVSTAILDGIRYGKVCKITFNINVTVSDSDWVTVATIPAGYTPAIRQYGICAIDSTVSAGEGKIAEVRVTTDNKLQIYSTIAKAYWGGIEYICS